MAKRIRRVSRHPFWGTIPDELIEAKEALRDRLAPAAETAVPHALALRKVKRFRPAPGVNLVGVGVGEKVTSGRRSGEMCVKVFVAKKYAKGQVSPADRIPPALDGIPTDVEGVGYPKTFQSPHRRRQRPLLGGVSTGLDFHAVDASFAGTLGVVVREPNESRRYALSNNHVFADENRVDLGAGVVQPGTLDGGRNADAVARLAAFAPLKFDNRRNWMDAAIARFDAGVAVDSTILGIGAPTASAVPTLGMLVRKSGRTTGVTEGVVRVVTFDVFGVEYEQGLVRVDDVVVIESTNGTFSRPGDSGSAIVDAQGRVVALLFAGSSVVTYAIPVRRVLRRFKVRIAT